MNTYRLCLVNSPKLAGEIADEALMAGVGCQFFPGDNLNRIACAIIAPSAADARRAATSISAHVPEAMIDPWAVVGHETEPEPISLWQYLREWIGAR